MIHILLGISSTFIYCAISILVEVIWFFCGILVDDLSVIKARSNGGAREGKQISGKSCNAVNLLNVLVGRYCLSKRAGL